MQKDLFPPTLIFSFTRRNIKSIDENVISNEMLKVTCMCTNLKQ